MKQLKNLVLAAVLLIGGTSIMNAQSKVAHINTQELVQAMPETKAAQAEIEKLSKTYQVQIQDMGNEYDAKVKRYDAEAATQTAEENQKRVEEVAGMRQSIAQFQQTAQQELQKKEFDLLKPITEKAKEAILKVARAQGFHYVLDSTQGQGVILADGKDLMEDVKKELGF
ncbi:OmpH family outer membrane protein [Flavobacteriaceae sp. LMIT009]